MTELFKQALMRAGMDGPVQVRRVTPGDTIMLSVTHLNQMQHIELSEYSAARLVCALAFMIGLPISSKVLKAVRMM